MQDTLKRKINLLIHLANADGDFDIKERAFIYNVSLRHGLNIDTIGDMIENPEAIQLDTGLSLETRIDYLTDCLLLILVDGKLLPKEINFCFTIGLQLGFDEAVLNRLVSLIRSEPSITAPVLQQHILGFAQPGVHPNT